MSTKGRISSRLDAVRKSPSLGRAIAREGVYGLALVLAGASILYLCVLLPSRLKTDRLRDRRNELQAEKTRLEREVDGLRGETLALETEPWAVERALRRRLNFIRPGERVLKLARS